MEPKIISKEEWANIRKGRFSEPEWWKKTRTYQVQSLEGNEWITKMTSDVEWRDDFKLAARNPFNRILKNGIDVTDNYRDEIQSTHKDNSTLYGVLNSMEGPTSSAKSARSSSAMKPSEYKSLSEEEKVKLWNSINSLLSQKAKRAEIFVQLNISEATYDTIRLDMKSNIENMTASTAAVKDSTPKQHNISGRLQKPSLLRRR